MTVSVPPERSEEARAAMIELFPEGFEEREGDAGVQLTAYTERHDAVARLEPLGSVRESPVAQGWEDAWKDFHEPVTIGTLWIGPPWEAAEAGLTPIVIDPGRAFGTGAHATTRLCIELLLELEPAGLVDLGCGSGVLAVAAAKLGFSPVVALDADELAVAAAHENAAANGVEVDARRADVLADPLPDVEVAVANIARVPVEQAIARFEGRIAMPRATWRRNSRNRGDGAPSTVASPPAGPQISSCGRRARARTAEWASIRAPWRRSPSTSSAARSRTRTRRRSASA